MKLPDSWVLRVAETDGAGTGRGSRSCRLTALLFLLWLVSFSSCLWAAAPPIHYEVDLRATASHLVKVSMTIPEAKSETQIQFPAWNALYQIRDFVREVQEVSATCEGHNRALERLDLYTWKGGEEPCARLEIHYAVYANEESVFSSVLNEQHAFLNLATILFYLPKERQRPVQLKYILPAEWNVATLLDGMGVPGEFAAANYDELVDSPAEAGLFREYEYSQKDAQYVVVVHADPEDYSDEKLLNAIRKITDAATDLMHDVPFAHYTFILHFPEAGTGGMEHRNGTAISFAAGDLKSNWPGLEAILAHEFFHAWNVKRIRPQNLEPVDYMHGNDTSDLWLAEGVTSAFQEYILLRARLLSQEAFFTYFANEIAGLQARPARITQSVEDSGREAWLEKYADYLRPERSISYYNKGALIGFLLDLAIRHDSGNRHGLIDVMRQLNGDFARRGRFFTKDDLLGVIAGLVTNPESIRHFFADYVSGVSELDYNFYLAFAGLRLAKVTVRSPALGFVPVSDFDMPITVESVQSGSDAERAGLHDNDVLLEMDGQRLRSSPTELVKGKKSGQQIRFRVRRDGREFTVKYPLEFVERTTYRIEESKDATAEQRRLREYWLKGMTIVAAEAEKR